MNETLSFFKISVVLLKEVERERERDRSSEK